MSEGIQLVLEYEEVFDMMFVCSSDVVKPVALILTLTL